MARAKIAIARTSSDSVDFQKLVQLLDAELAQRDGELNDFYHQFNGIEALRQVLVLYSDKEAVACGAFKLRDRHSAEIKRMYVKEEYRKQGLASKLLHELEDWGREMGLKSLVLETGINQPEAIALYEKSGFKRIANYPPYVGVESSFCFEKVL